MCFGRKLLIVVGPADEQCFYMMVIYYSSASCLTLFMVFQAFPRLLPMEMKEAFNTKSLLWFYYGNSNWMNSMCSVSSFVV